MINVDEIQIFNNNKATLKETSKDNHDGVDTFMTTSTLDAVDFDAVKDEYIKEMNLVEAPKSNDALFIGRNGEFYFIEFKNGVMKDKKIYDIRLKIFDSLLIFSDIVGEGISFTRKSLSYILVYNEKKNSSNGETNSNTQISHSRELIAKYFIESKAKKKYIRFNLERFEKLYFKNVFTYTEEEFENRFISSFSA